MTTPSEIKAIGGKRYLKKRWKKILIALGMSIIWVPLVDYLTTEVAWWVYIAPLTIVSVNILVTYMQSREAFYKKVMADPTILG
jgi:uncharacterized membrane protein